MTRPTPNSPPFSIVGIGASAGGIEALQAFFEALPEQLGIAFVVMVHLDPEHRSELAPILARKTRMPVEEVSGTVPLKADRVYIISPDQRLQIINTKVGAFPFEQPRGQRAPVDLFFRSLAEQYGDGFAVILSGSGSDGAGGVKAVKEQGGLILVQDPKEAAFDRMPYAAIATGLADVVLPLRELARRLGELVKSKQRIRERLEAAEPLKDDDEAILERILAHLHARTGHDFSQYKRATVLRRLARRMQVQRQDTLDGYLGFLRHNVEEAQALFQELLISVTTFFRDREAWEALGEQVIPHLFESQEPDMPLRLWVPGCATGEEAYTLAIFLLEEAERRSVWPEIQIFASDLDEGMLATAREGRYPAVIEADLSEARLARFFRREDEHYRIIGEVRDRILFATHNLLRDPPFTRLDLISCRNLLIYLDRKLREQVFGIFRYALRPGGYLFLGASENAEGDHFRMLDKKHHIFQARQTPGQTPRLPELLLTPPPVRAPAEHRRARPQPPAVQTVHRALLEDLAPPSLLVDEQRHVLHLSATVGRFLQPPGGRPTCDVTALVRPALQAELRTALYRAFKKHEASLSAFVPVQFNGTPRRVAVLVQPRRAEDQERLALVIFLESDKAAPAEEAPAEEPSAALVRQLQEELAETQTRLQDAREEFEATNEELRSANEELQSISEEYRSTVEELETSREELQSINEELQTVNNELKNKLDETSRAHSDLENLMAATEIGVLFLDRSLRIHRFTPRVTELFHIKSGDCDRPITDFTHCLDYQRLEADAHQVLRELTPIEHEAKSEDGRWYLVRLRPYRTVNHRIDGVVVTVVDISEHKQAEQAIRASERRLRRMVNVEGVGVLIFDQNGTVVEANDAFLHMFGYSRAEVEAKSLTWRTMTPAEYIDLSEQQMQKLAQIGRIGPYEKEYLRKDGSRSWMVFAGASLGDGTVIEYCIDVSDRKQAEAALQDAVEQLRRRTEQLREQDRHKNEFLGMLGHELRNPLAAISNTVDLLQRVTLPPDEHRQQIDRIKRQVTHLLHLVDDLLNVTRISRGQIALKKAPLSLADSIMDAVDQVRPQIEARHHRLALNRPKQPLYVEADRERLTQIVANLLSNAAHYTEERGNITLTVERDDDQACIRVRDTGIGMTPKQLSHLFEPFRRLESAAVHHQGGLGLGLALARKLAELHGGSLEAFSAGPGQGSEFTLRLPALPEGQSVAPGPLPADHEAEVPARRVLLVEDDEAVGAAMAKLLWALGHEVRIVSRGGQALEAVRTFRPELVFLDIGLPDLSGYEVARQLRQAYGAGAFHLVALTGYGQEDLQKKAAGFDHYLLKPVRVKELQAILRDL